MNEMEMEAPVGSIEAKDPFAVAPPGHSLTEDNSKWAWGKPPQIVDPEQALEGAIASLQRPKVRDEMFKLLYTGVSIEVMLKVMCYRLSTMVSLCLTLVCLLDHL